MNDELKEILEFKENADYKRLSVDEIVILQDYITNLQQDNTMYAQLKDEYEEEIKDLQQELKEANESVEWWTNRFKAVEKENEKKDAYIKYLQEYNPKYYKGEKFYGDSREELQTRIDEAIQYIKCHTFLHNDYGNEYYTMGEYFSPNWCIDILKGNDEGLETLKTFIDYKERVKKAIVYIEKEYEDNDIIVDYTDNPITPQDLYADLLDILKGGNNG